MVDPASYFGAGRWNQPHPWAPADEQTGWRGPGQATALNASCRVYAPRYRQATMCAFLADREAGRAALDLAYGDVKRAFEHFAKSEPSAPLVLCGHSQGGRLLMRLLSDVVERDPALRARLVVAYLVGSKCPRDMFDRGFPSLHASAGPRDVGAVACWDTLDANAGAKPPSELDPFGTNPGVRYPGGWEPQPNTGFLETSPLTWRSCEGERADVGWLGSAEVASDDTGPSMQELMGDAVIGTHKAPRRAVPERGTEAAHDFFVETKGHCIMVPTLSPEHHGVYRAFTAKGDYHCLDVPLFWFNLRQNVAERVAAYSEGGEI